MARCITRQRPRRSGFHLPAAIGGARSGLGIHADKQCGHSRFRRRQRQSPRRGQVDGRGAAISVHQYRRWRARADTVGCDAQRFHRIAGIDKDDLFRTHTHMHQPRRIGPPCMARGCGIADPDQRPLIPRQPQRQQQGEGRCCHTLPIVAENLMQCRHRQAALQFCIDLGRTQRTQIFRISPLRPIVGRKLSDRVGNRTPIVHDLFFIRRNPSSSQVGIARDSRTC